MVVAVVALSLAMIGTAVAGPDAISDKITRSKIKSIAKKQANKAITAREATLNVNRAKTADKATLADKATNATNAENATNATNAESSTAPFAYAHVTEARTVDASQSKGLSSANILLSGTGLICFDVPFAFKTVQATQDSSDVTVDALVTIHTLRPGIIIGCPAGTDLLTISIDGGGAGNDEDFDLWFGN